MHKNNVFHYFIRARARRNRYLKLQLAAGAKIRVNPRTHLSVYFEMQLIAHLQ